MDELERFGRLVMELQRGARTQSQQGFIGWALQTLEQALPFDAALWGSGHYTTVKMEVHTVQLHRLPAHFMTDYAAVQPSDQLQHQSAQRLGITVLADAHDAGPALTPFLQRHGLQYAFSTADADRLTSLLNVIAIYRRDRERPFTERERRFMQAIFPHLTEACTQNRLTHLVNSSGPRFAGPWRPAAADSTGLLHVADSEFARLLRLEWPDWTGPYLPAPLRAATGSAEVQRIAGQHVVCKFSPMTDLCLVQLRECALVDRLTPREREVAVHAAQGHSHKDIARLLELAPATVRNHLATACRRLQVRNKAHMAALVQGLE